MKPVKCRDLRHRVWLRRPVLTSDGSGGYVTSWSAPLPIWANVTAFAASTKGDEAVASEALQSIRYYRIVTRWRDDITPKDQLLWRGRELNITSADDPDGDRRQLAIVATTSSAQAMS